MGTSENVQTWSKTAGDNDDVDIGINWAEGQDPGTVNNSARGMMAATAKYVDDRDGGLVAIHTPDVNTLTLSTNQNLEASHITAGLTLAFRVGSTNTGAATLNPDGKGAVAIVDQSGNALTGGELVAGSMATVMYNSNTSNWRLVSAVGVPEAVRLAAGSVSNAPQLDIVLASHTAYRGIKFVLTGLHPAVNGVDLWARFSSDGGATFDSGSVDYQYNVKYLFDNGTDYDLPSAAGDTKLRLTNSNNNGTSDSADLTIEIHNHSSITAKTNMLWQGAYGSSIQYGYVMGGGRRAAAENTNAIRFMFSSGNISACSFAVYGQM